MGSTATTTQAVTVLPIFVSGKVAKIDTFSYHFAP